MQGLSSLEIKIKSKCKYRAVSCIVKRMSKKYVFFYQVFFLVSCVPYSEKELMKNGSLTYLDGSKKEKNYVL